MDLNNLKEKSEVHDYFMIRAKQLLKHNYGIIGLSMLYEGIVVAYFGKYNPEYKTIFHESSEKLCSIYILEDYRGKGLYESTYKRIAEENGRKLRVLTSKQCEIDDFLTNKGIPFQSLDLSLGFVEYDIISKYYGDTVAKRSGVRLMNHIDEGLRIMKDIHSSEDSMRAYCLHPIIQTETDLSKFDFTGVSERVMELALEYKRVANAYLSDKYIRLITDIELSSIEVNDMLIADKIQNRKDFEIYHKGKHERSNELEAYFNNWFKRLAIPFDFYNSEKEKIQ